MRNDARTFEQRMEQVDTEHSQTELSGDLLRQLEIAEVFDAAAGQGRDLWAGHVLADAGLDYVTDGPFDATDDEKARVEELSPRAKRPVRGG